MEGATVVPQSTFSRTPRMHHTYRPSRESDLFDQHPLAYSHLPPTLILPDDLLDDENEKTDEDYDHEDCHEVKDSKEEDEEDDNDSSPASSSQIPVFTSSEVSHQSSQSSLDSEWYMQACRGTPRDQQRDSVMTEGTMATALASDGSCKFEEHDWFAQFNTDLDISDDPPSRPALREAGDTYVYDAAGNARAFKTLFTPGDVVGERQLIVFIRHFFCGACQAYVRALTATINTEVYFSMPKPTSIMIVGCGSPELIRHYKAATQSPFPIFADPTRQLFKLLGMDLTYRHIGWKRPEYVGSVNIYQWWMKQVVDVSHVKGRRKFQGGHLLQIGGEFLFENGEIVWCHRMRNMRGHAEMDVIKRVLEIDR